MPWDTAPSAGWASSPPNGSSSSSTPPAAPPDGWTRRALGALATGLRVARYAQQVMAARARAGRAPGPEIALNKIALSTNMARLGDFVADVLGPSAGADTG